MAFPMSVMLGFLYVEFVVFGVKGGVCLMGLCLFVGEGLFAFREVDEVLAPVVEDGVPAVSSHDADHSGLAISRARSAWRMRREPFRSGTVTSLPSAMSR